ncbi:MAG TPA: hypothetical protein VGY31_07785 [Terriglobia bacterium]|nr:hypothetical protein [Terriglobia bacterium]
MDHTDTNSLVEKVKSAAGDNLRSVVLYGPSANEDSKHSDIHILCLLRQIDVPGLARLQVAAKWWMKKGHSAFLVFTLEELQRSADIYAVELLEIKTCRRVLFGEDVFDSFETPVLQYRQQVERELRHSLIRLRQSYVLAAGNHKTVMGLMVKSLSTFGLLFRHALIALGEEAPATNLEAVERLAALLGFSTTSFRDLAGIRKGERKGKDLDARLIFQDYLESITRAVDVIDERLATGT